MLKASNTSKIKIKTKKNVNLFDVFSTVQLPSPKRMHESACRNKNSRTSGSISCSRIIIATD